MKAVMTEQRTAIIGALLIVIGPLSLSLYTPAMPILVQAFETTPAMLKLSLSVYFCGFAVSQLICGPLSDAFGRRPAAIGFFCIYVAGSILAATASDISWFIAARGIQGVGAAAGPAISRTIVRDQFTGQASARILNLIGTMLAIGPAVAPTLGGVILGVLGWQAIFYVMVACGLSALCFLALAVPETNTSPNLRQIRPSFILRNYATLLSHAGFMRASLLIGFSLGGIYTLAAILPFVLIESAGLTPTQFGLSMLCQTLSYMLGTVVAGRALKRVEADRLIPIGVALVLVAGLTIGALAWLVPPSFITVMGPVGLWAFGVALLLPGGTTSALSGFPRMAGAAAALMGCMQIGGGFIGSAVASLLPSPLMALGTVVPAIAVLSLLPIALLRPPSIGPGRVEEADLEIATDPAGLIGAAGEEIEAEIFKPSRTGSRSV